jgi:hypothetical protein
MREFMTCCQSLDDFVELLLSSNSLSLLYLTRSSQIMIILPYSMTKVQVYLV